MNRNQQEIRHSEDNSKDVKTKRSASRVAAGVLTALVMAPVAGLATAAPASATTDNCLGHPSDNVDCIATYATPGTHLFEALPNGTPVFYRLWGAPGGNGAGGRDGAGGPGGGGQVVSGWLTADRTNMWVIRVGGRGGNASGSSGGSGGVNGGAPGGSGNQSGGGGGGGGGATGIYFAERTMWETGRQLAVAAGGGGGGGAGHNATGGNGGDPADNGSAGTAGESVGPCGGGSGGPEGAVSTFGGGGGRAFNVTPGGGGGGGAGGGGGGAPGCSKGSSASSGTTVAGGRGGDGQACVRESGGVSLACTTVGPAGGGGGGGGGLYGGAGGGGGGYNYNAEHSFLMMSISGAGGGGGAGSGLGGTVETLTSLHDTTPRAELRWPKKQPTTTTLTSSAASSTFGSPVTFGAAVSQTASSPGTVSFEVDGQVIVGCETQPLSQRHSHCTTSTLRAGSHSIVARYSGDHYNYPNRSAPRTHVVTASSAMKVRCTPNPVSYPNTAQCTAAVEGPGVTPTGKVTWRSSGGGSFPATSCELSAGSCLVTYRPSASDVRLSGAITIYANYAGDAYYTATSASTLLAVRR